jgi:uncharacterized protein (TIGR02284 family)
MNERDVIETLNDLIKLDYDAIEGYEQAVKRAEDPNLRGTLQQFLEDHQRHTVNLGAEVRKLGGQPPDGPGMMRMLTEGAVMMGAMMHDKGVLQAMSSNEAITNRSYEAALGKLGEHQAALVVRQNREDERRHKQWVDQQLEAMGASGMDRGAAEARNEASQRPRDIR